jgi:hypothetical protein
MAHPCKITEIFYAIVEKGKTFSQYNIDFSPFLRDLKIICSNVDQESISIRWELDGISQQSKRRIKDILNAEAWRDRYKDCPNVNFKEHPKMDKYLIDTVYSLYEPNMTFYDANEFSLEILFKVALNIGLLLGLNGYHEEWMNLKYYVNPLDYKIINSIITDSKYNDLMEYIRDYQN